MACDTSGLAPFAVACLAWSPLACHVSRPTPAEASVDAAFPAVSPTEPPARESASAPLEDDALFDACAPGHAGCIRGSPADVHTPEGPAGGYRVYRHCPNYSHFDVVAIVGTGMKDIPQFGWQSPSFGTRSEAEREGEFWAFAHTLRDAVADSSIHSVGASVTCFVGQYKGGKAVVLKLHDWRAVDQDIRKVGSWLAANDWNGEVVLWPEPVPGPLILL